MEKYVKYKTKYLQMKGGSASTLTILASENILGELPKYNLFKFDDLDSKIGEIDYNGAEWFFVIEDYNYQKSFREKENLRELVLQFSNQNLYRMNNGTFEKISEKSEFRYPTFDIYSNSTKIGTISFTYSMSKWFYDGEKGIMQSIKLDDLIYAVNKANPQTRLYFKKVNIRPTPTTPSKGN